MIAHTCFLQLLTDLEKVIYVVHAIVGLMEFALPRAHTESCVLHLANPKHLSVAMLYFPSFVSQCTSILILAYKHSFKDNSFWILLLSIGHLFSLFEHTHQVKYLYGATQHQKKSQTGQETRAVR